MGPGPWWRRGAAYAGAALMVHGVLIHNSRGAMLGTLIVGVMIFLLLPKQPRHFLAFLLAVLLAVRMAGPQVQQRFETIFASHDERDGSAQSRLDLWADMADAMGRHPLFGLGPDHWPLVAASYGWPGQKEGHGMWLQLGAELGLPGMACILLFYGLAAARLWPWARRRGGTSWTRGYRPGADGRRDAAGVLRGGPVRVV